MSIKINHELPVPEVLKNEYPLSNEQKSIKQQRDEEIRRIFTGESDKFVVLVGPCSADNEDTVCEYAFSPPLSMTLCLFLLAFYKCFVFFCS